MHRVFQTLLVLCLATSARAVEPVALVATDTGSKTSSAALPTGPLTRAIFVESLSRDLSDHFRLEGDFQLELIRAWSSPARVAADWRVVITEYPSIAASAMIVRCRTVADGVASSEETVTVRASLWRDAWVSRQPIANGAAFDPALLETRRVDLLRERDALPAAVGDNTFQFSRGVNAGRVLTWRDIARRPLVRKDDIVEVTATDGALTVIMKARAMENGAKGDTVTVRNVESQKNFTAFVVDANHVQVRF